MFHPFDRAVTGRPAFGTDRLTCRGVVRAVILGVLALAAPLAMTGPAAAEGYHVDRYAYVVGVDVYDHLNMRRWPAAHSQRVGIIPHHADGFYVQRCIVRPNDSSSDWCKVRYRGAWGWVNKRYLNIDY